LPNLLFAYIPRNKAELIVKGLPPSRDNKGQGNDPAAGLSKEEETQIISLSALVSFYYNHFEKEKTGVDKLLTIPTGQMDNFIRATRVRNQHTMLVDPSKLSLKAGDTVRITEGDFVGVVGKVARIKGQKRVVVALEGVCAIATAYIPSAFLEPYSPTED
jgi:transcription antitermination factor NusG